MCGKIPEFDWMHGFWHQQKDTLYFNICIQCCFFPVVCDPIGSDLWPTALLFFLPAFLACHHSGWIFACTHSEPHWHWKSGHLMWQHLVSHVCLREHGEIYFTMLLSITTQHSGAADGFADPKTNSSEPQQPRQIAHALWTDSCSCGEGCLIMGSVQGASLSSSACLHLLSAHPSHRERWRSGGLREVTLLIVIRLLISASARLLRTVHLGH